MSNEQMHIQQQLASLEQIQPESPVKVDRMLELAERIAISMPRDSLELISRAETLAERLDYTRGRIHGMTMLGFAQFMMSDFETARENLQQAYDLAEKAEEKDLQAFALTIMAIAQQNLGNFDEAFALAFQGLKMNQAMGNRRLEAWNLYAAAGGFQEMGDLPRALDYLERASRLFGETGDRVGAAWAHNGIGRVHQSRHEFDTAHRFFFRSLRLFEGVGNIIGEARALHDLGQILVERAEYEPALLYHLKSLQLRISAGNKQAQTMSLINIGRLFLRQNDTDKALGFLQKALVLSTEIKVKPRLYQAHEALSQAFEMKGDKAKALQHYQRFHQLKEQVFNDETNARIKNLQIRFETEQSEKEAELIRLKNEELQDKNRQLEKLLQELHEAQTQLIQSEKLAAMGALVAGVVHELNNPVGAITSSADAIGRCAASLSRLLDGSADLAELKANPRLQRTLDILQNTGRVNQEAGERVSRLVNSLKRFVRLDEAVFQKTDIHQCLENTIVLLENHLQDRIRLVREYGDLPEMACFPAELNQVFMNLLTNAIQAIAGEGVITIRTRREDDMARIEFRDTGQGIPSDRLARLFEPNFTRQGERVKAGLGLPTCLQIVRQHHGTIEVESTPGQGTTFTVSLPMEWQADWTTSRSVPARA
ncbi:MAG: tetratricopeptide repeat protein [Acidobacteria bacterium]|nr:tetratricopeptide repeat protein [Acidobacteriota bacterium]